MQGRILENVKPVPVAVPLNTTGAAVASDWINLKSYRRLLFVIIQGATAGGTPAVTLLQAKTNSGGTSKSLSFTEYYSGTALTADTLAQAAVASDTFNLTASANVFTCIEVAAQDLDVDNGYTHVQLGIASPGSNANYICVLALLADGAFSGKPALLPSAIV